MTTERKSNPYAPPAASGILGARARLPDDLGPGVALFGRLSVLWAVLMGPVILISGIQEPERLSDPFVLFEAAFVCACVWWVVLLLRRSPLAFTIAIPALLASTAVYGLHLLFWGTAIGVPSHFPPLDLRGLSSYLASASASCLTRRRKRPEWLLHLKAIVMPSIQTGLLVPAAFRWYHCRAELVCPTPL